MLDRKRIPVRLSRRQSCDEWIRSIFFGYSILFLEESELISAGFHLPLVRISIRTSTIIFNSKSFSYKFWIDKTAARILSLLENRKVDFSPQFAFQFTSIDEIFYSVDIHSRGNVPTRIGYNLRFNVQIGDSPIRVRLPSVTPSSIIFQRDWKENFFRFGVSQQPRNNDGDFRELVEKSGYRSLSLSQRKYLRCLPRTRGGSEKE